MNLKYSHVFGRIDFLASCVMKQRRQIATLHANWQPRSSQEAKMNNGYLRFCIIRQKSSTQTYKLSSFLFGFIALSAKFTDRPSFTKFMVTGIIPHSCKTIRSTLFVLWIEFILLTIFIIGLWNALDIFVTNQTLTIRQQAAKPLVFVVRDSRASWCNIE